MHLVTDFSFYRSLLRLAFPICIQNLLVFGVTMTDSLLVGQLGEASISGLYLGCAFTHVVMNFIFGISSTSIILTSQYWGVRNKEAIKDIGSMAARLQCAIGLVAFLIAWFFPAFVPGLMSGNAEAVEKGSQYIHAASFSFLFLCVSQAMITTLRGVEVVAIGMQNAMLSFVVNLILNPIFIYGLFGAPRLEVVGAGAVTSFSRLIEFLFVSFYLFKIDQTLGFKVRDFLRWNRVLFRDMVKYGIPLVAGQLVWACNQFSRGYFNGHMASESFAIVSILDSIDGMAWTIPLGFAMAASILMGKTIGRNDFVLAKKQAYTLQLVFASIGILIGLVLWMGWDAILSCYKLAPESLAVAGPFLLVMTVASIGRCYQAPSLMGIVKAGGDTSFVFKNDSFWFFCWILPGCMLLRQIGAPDYCVYTMVLSDQVTKCFVALVKINRFRWMRNLTRPEWRAATGSGGPTAKSGGPTASYLGRAIFEHKGTQRATGQDE
ncbi:MAG: MATE family efflux transporter [Kiritimatiellia bacterium]